ncbi:TetR/AcrR family transcriptional regulator [Actinomadura atramentaria]|uniref:TetR/AcrR family transcriptional regulator n=1 Tax=Actinomadura atramentaria TaxID=1990 RepID=UPI00146EA377|nr:TetR/AcrR family transcriptional regulator [Actinomadura atramentaria]
MSGPPRRLAEVYEPGRPGLPRGRSSLPAEVVRAEQRRRLLAACISAVAANGYAQTTVAQVVARARVSRKAFYDHFADLQDCFLSAMSDAQAAIVRELTELAPARPRSARAALRSGLGAYLALCAREPEYARCILVELPAAGPRALRGRDRGYRLVGDVLRAWREHAARRRPEWRAVPDEVYPAAVGAVAELILAHVLREDTARLPELLDPLTEILLRVLDAPLPPDPA